MKNYRSSREKEELKAFLNKLNELVEDFHHEIYLLDDVFKGIRTIEIAILNELNELNKDKAN